MPMAVNISLVSVVWVPRINPNTDAPHKNDVRFENPQFLPSVSPKCQLENNRKNSKARGGAIIHNSIMMSALER
jgi:hypothetical protein